MEIVGKAVSFAVVLEIVGSSVTLSEILLGTTEGLVVLSSGVRVGLDVFVTLVGIKVGMLVSLLVVLNSNVGACVKFVMLVMLVVPLPSKRVGIKVSFSVCSNVGLSVGEMVVGTNESGIEGI